LLKTNILKTVLQGGFFVCDTLKKTPCMNEDIKIPTFIKTNEQEQEPVHTLGDGIIHHENSEDVVGKTTSPGFFHSQNRFDHSNSFKNEIPY
jgi:hypothetical protein